MNIIKQKSDKYAFSFAHSQYCDILYSYFSDHHKFDITIKSLYNYMLVTIILLVVCMWCQRAVGPVVGMGTV